MLEGLKHQWTADDVKKLGRQLWMLNSPFPRFGRVAGGPSSSHAFEIDFQSDLPGIDESFASQVRAAIDNYSAVIEGELTQRNGKTISHVRVEFRDEDEQYSEEFEQPTSLIRKAKWQIRIYDLQGRQPGGIPVPRYLAEFDRRWNSRKTTDGERTVDVLRSASGKRLTYKETVN